MSPENVFHVVIWRWRIVRWTISPSLHCGWDNQTYDSRHFHTHQSIPWSLWMLSGNGPLCFHHRMKAITQKNFGLIRCDATLQGDKFTHAVCFLFEFYPVIFLPSVLVLQSHTHLRHLGIMTFFSTFICLQFSSVSGVTQNLQWLWGKYVYSIFRVRWD